MKAPYTPGYHDAIGSGSARSAAVIVPLLLELVDVKSVVDVGCGTGEWLAEFGRRGACTLLGLDGAWVNRTELKIPQECFQVADVGQPVQAAGSFDLAVCPAVGEHLHQERADSLVASLTGLAAGALVFQP